MSLWNGCFGLTGRTAGGGGGGQLAMKMEKDKTGGFSGGLHVVSLHRCVFAAKFHNPLALGSCGTEHMSCHLHGFMRLMDNVTTNHELLN